MPIAEEEEKPMVVAQNHDNGGFDRPIESDDEDSESDDDGDELWLGFVSQQNSRFSQVHAQDIPHSYKAPDLNRSLRPPRA